ncbi:MAG: BsaWI family type II restriction enzyme [Campylobacter sp.]|uniref:BsaWI family type II restriction enzyme n=1 Tax=Campylobacter sp. TaxID=205 RepID=UPI002A88D1B0|nr:BsaWI family type II restriction enzyme [Campylobacter sp.]MCI6343160.1 BsaWI family type II restriction enzyme [Campylobacter sp.]MDY4013275.1 BsaWI family type II restriction enzyme [Campylobacter sp.]MDY4860177.1 BsaWI family type II restriction enzyme [Campylobacter sp.]
MKANEIVVQNFLSFYKLYRNNAFRKIKEFLSNQKEIFYENKISELQNNGLSKEEAVIKTRQGWVNVVSRSLEQIIEIIICDFCNKHKLKITNDKILKSKNLDEELNLVKRAILVDFGENCVLPDGDIIIYKIVEKRVKILAILSIKNSFRERYTETPYWKLKLAENNLTKDIKVFMITPDNDDEISFLGVNPKKSRIVMEYELDGIYLAKESFDESDKIKSIDKLIDDLGKLL